MQLYLYLGNPFLRSCFPYLTLSAPRVLRLLLGEITRLFRRGRRKMHASRPHTAGKLCAPQIRPIRVIRGCLLFPQLVSIRVDSWLASQKRRQVAALRKGPWLPRSFYAPKRFAVSVQSVSSVVACSFFNSCLFVSIRGYLQKS